MYTYKYVEAQNTTLFKEANYKELIDENAKEGWRFVSAIPKEFSSTGDVKYFDLVFEKKLD